MIVNKNNKIVLVDIDGVVNDIPEGLMKQYRMENYQNFNEGLIDLAPDRHMGSIVRQLANIYNIVFLTGRPACYRESTAKFLDSFMNGAPYHLAMRSNCCKKTSALSKMTWIQQNVDVDKIAFAIDDRKDIAEQFLKTMGVRTLLVKVDKFKKSTEDIRFELNLRREILEEKETKDDRN